MAIDAANPDARKKLARAIQFHNDQRANVRKRRKELTSLFKGRPDQPLDLLQGKTGTIVNLFQQFVLAQQLAMAWRGPKFSVRARTMAGRSNGFDRRVQTFLNRYSEVLGLPATLRQIAVDSCFGWGVVKIINTIAPKGVTAPIAPRAYRIDPDAFVVDGTASSLESCAWMADTFLVPLDEAKAAFPHRAEELKPWNGSTSGTDVATQTHDVDAYAEEYVRLVDVYIPSQGKVYTWQASTDTFVDIYADPLEEIESPICPYEVIALLQSNSLVDELSRLESLKELHVWANDAAFKIARQTRQAKRNPVGAQGEDLDVDTLVSTPDGEAAMIENPSGVGLYQIPGPDQSVVSSMQMAMGMFSSLGGSLEVALGSSPGASTARQTQALLQQITARQSIDREALERFAANVGKKLATLAFLHETLEMEVQEQVPGTRYTVNNGWQDPQKLPRVAEISDFNFEVVPYSTSFRTPEEFVSQLTQVSGELVQLLGAAAQGAPLNVSAVIDSYAEAYDMIPQLREWWSGEQPKPQETAVKSGQYVAQPNSANGSTLTYQSDSQQGGGSENPGFSEQPAGLTMPMAGGVA